MTDDPRPVALLVCNTARDVEDARLLLTMLGLLDPDTGRLVLPQGPPPGLDIRNTKNIASVGMSTRL